VFWSLQTLGEKKIAGNKQGGTHLRKVKNQGKDKPNLVPEGEVPRRSQVKLVVKEKTKGRCGGGWVCVGTGNHSRVWLRTWEGKKLKKMMTTRRLRKYDISLGARGGSPW